MNQLVAVAVNAFLQTLRQPVYGIIVLVTLGGLGLAPSVTGWTLDDDDKMLRDIGLSTLLVQGLFLACFAASGVLNAEIDDKTVLTSAAKPISRPVFVVGKYAGVLAALAVAQFLAGVALMMALRHGVLQMAYQTPDTTVLVFGPTLLMLILIAAAVANYLWDWRFFPAVMAMLVPAAVFSSLVLLVINRDWKLQSYQVTQTMDDFPKDLVGREHEYEHIIEFRPLPGESAIAGHRGVLIRSLWQGPITDGERAHLLNLTKNPRWQKDINYLITESRKFQALDVFKAALLVFIAVSLLTAIAVAVSTRLGTVWSFIACALAICAGLLSDHYLQPLVGQSQGIVDWAGLAYRLIPNFQCFWMVDALSEEQVIPWAYVLRAAGYGLVFIAAFIALAAALFETREVG